MLSMSDAATYTFVANTPGAVGTCIETLDDDGVYLRSGVQSEGNYAICHWMYVELAASNKSSSTLGGSYGTNWGETRYLNEKEWGTHGSAILGTNIQTQGTAIGAAHGFALSHTSLLTYVAGTVYQ